MTLRNLTHYQRRVPVARQIAGDEENFDVVRRKLRFDEIARNRVLDDALRTRSVSDGLELKPSPSLTLRVRCVTSCFRLVVPGGLRGRAR